MYGILKKIMNDYNSNNLSKTKDKDAIASLLKINKEAFEKFERSYAEHALKDIPSDNIFDINAKQASEIHEGIVGGKSDEIDGMIDRIVNELLGQTQICSFDGKKCKSYKNICKKKTVPVSNEEIMALPGELRPQLTGSLMKVDISEPAYMSLLDSYQRYLKELNPKVRLQFYHQFRQGLDILDLDPIIYEIIGTNRNSMGYWLPKIADTVTQLGFFKIPQTTIIKVPLTMLQLTRLDYMQLTRTTLDIVDKFCQIVFRLDESKDYFIKTGTYSSKYDFRNAHIHGSKEVRELGEYLLFIHHQACQMASPLNNRCIYGVSTTNEWVVREFIDDKENNPCIYKGLPLHTEYRVFVDFDRKEIIGLTPYWDATVMKQRFAYEDDSESAHNVHDYIIYEMHESILAKRYKDNKELVKLHITEILQENVDLTGQWSIDVMQNGNDFWIIDMALAANSALSDCVPAKKLKPLHENWIPSGMNAMLHNISDT